MHVASLIWFNELVKREHTTVTPAESQVTYGSLLRGPKCQRPTYLLRRPYCDASSEGFRNSSRKHMLGAF